MMTNENLRNDLVSDREPPKFGLHFALRLLYVSIAASGLIGALIVLLNNGGNIAGNGFMTILTILVLDGFVLLGLIARHYWLRNTIWLSSLAALIPTVLTIWTDGNTRFHVFSSRLSGALFAALSLFVIAAVVSLAHGKVEKDPLKKVSYLTALHGFIASGVVSALTIVVRPIRAYELGDYNNIPEHSAFDSVSEFLGRLSVAAVVVSLSALLILGVANIVSTSRANAEKRRNFEKAQREYHQRFGLDIAQVPPARVDVPFPPAAPYRNVSENAPKGFDNVPPQGYDERDTKNIRIPEQTRKQQQGDAAAEDVE